MGNVFMSGISPEYRDQLQFEYSHFPAWLNLWIPGFIDLICSKVCNDPRECRLAWRSYLPASLTGPGKSWSEEFEITTVTDYFYIPMTFEEFQEMRGIPVTKGSGFFAGLGGGVHEWASSLYEYLFHTPSTALSTLVSSSGLGTVLLLVMLIRCIKAVWLPLFENIGRYLARKAHGDAWLQKNEIRITKFGEYVYRLCYHSFISAVGLYIFWDAPWFDESQGGTINLYTNFPRDPVKASMSWYYLFQSAYNVDAMYSLLKISLRFKFNPENTKWPVVVGWAETADRLEFKETVMVQL